MIVCDRLDWATSSRIAQEISQFEKRGTEQKSLTHASNFGDPQTSRELTVAYSKWATTAEVQMLSVISHDPKLIRPFTGSGLPHKTAILPVARKEPPEYMVADGELSFLYHLSSLLSAARLESERGHRAAATEINRRLSCLEVPPMVKDLSLIHI